MNEPQRDLKEHMRAKRWDCCWEGMPCTNLLAASNRPALKLRPWQRRHAVTHACALVLMGATIARASNFVARSWIDPEALVLFRKWKAWQVADPKLKTERAAALKSRAWREARGHTLDLQTRWRGEQGHQWARHWSWEFLI